MVLYERSIRQLQFIYIYRDGVSIGSSSKGDHDVDNVSTIISGDGAWDGLMDEVRISSTNRSADWIKFEYRNMAEADNELTFSAEEEAPETSSPSNLIGNPYMFTGRRFDREILRHFDPAQCRLRSGHAVQDYYNIIPESLSE